MARKVFYSFHYKPDNWRASMVRNMGAIEGNPPVRDNDWETVKSGGDAGIRRWIAQQLEGRTCTVVLVGTETSQRRWVLHEITESWNRGMGVVAIHIHGLKNNEGQQAVRGPSPLSVIDSGRLGQIAQTIDPPYSTSDMVYATIKNSLASLVEAAVQIRAASSYKVPKIWRQSDNSVAVFSEPTFAHFKLADITKGLGWTLTTNDENNKVLVASTGISLLSWGEEVTIRTTRGALGASVAVSSKASGVTDWGKSSENVKKVLAAIEREWDL
jgi:hypothetical protein